MALSTTFEVSKGLFAPNAYLRVNNISIVHDDVAGVTVNVYADSENTKEPVKTLCYGFEYDLNGENAVKQAYSYLKTLPEFSEAEDC